MKHEYLFNCLGADRWIPCTVISKNSVTGEFYISYEDCFVGRAEASVAPPYIRLAENQEGGVTTLGRIE